MKYTVGYSYNIDNKIEHVDIEYGDVPFSIEKVYSNLIESLNGVSDHFIYNVNDRKIIEINNKIIITLKEYNKASIGTSGFLQISIRGVDSRINSGAIRIPRNQFEVYTLSSIVQSIIYCNDSRRDYINILSNIHNIYCKDFYFKSVPVYINGVKFGVSKIDDSYSINVLIQNYKHTDIVKFDDIDDYYTVATNFYNVLLNDGIIHNEILDTFSNMVFEISKNKSCTEYTHKNITISYVGPFNVHVMLIGGISFNTTIDNLKVDIDNMISQKTEQLNILQQEVNGLNVKIR